MGIYGDTHFWVTRISKTMGMIELSGLKFGNLKVKSRGNTLKISHRQTNGYEGRCSSFILFRMNKR